MCPHLAAATALTGLGSMSYVVVWRNSCCYRIGPGPTGPTPGPTGSIIRPITLVDIDGSAESGVTTRHYATRVTLSLFQGPALVLLLPCRLPGSQCQSSPGSLLRGPDLASRPVRLGGELALAGGDVSRSGTAGPGLRSQAVQVRVRVLSATGNNRRRRQIVDSSEYDGSVVRIVSWNPIAGGLVQLVLGLLVAWTSQM